MILTATLRVVASLPTQPVSQLKVGSNQSIVCLKFPYLSKNQTGYILVKYYLAINIPLWIKMALNEIMRNYWEPKAC